MSEPMHTTGDLRVNGNAVHLYGKYGNPIGCVAIACDPAESRGVRDWNVVDANARLFANAAKTLRERDELLAACAKTNRLMDNLMKAVPWGQTFGLDMALLNEVLIELPNAIAKVNSKSSEDEPK